MAKRQFATSHSGGWTYVPLLVVRSPVLLFTTPAGRAILTLAALGAALWYLPARWPTVFPWSWAFFAFHAWLTATALCVAVKPQLGKRLKFWRFAIAGLLFYLSAMTALALLSINQWLPFNSVWGYYIAFAPFVFERGEIGTLTASLVGARSVLLLLAGLFVAGPSQLIATAILSARWARNLMNWITLPLKRFLNWRERRDALATAARLTYAANAAANAHGKARDAAAPASDYGAQASAATPSATASVADIAGERRYARKAQSSYNADFPWLFFDATRLTDGAPSATSEGEIERNRAAIAKLFKQVDINVKTANVIAGHRYSFYETTARKPILVTDAIRELTAALSPPAALATRGDMVQGIAIANDTPNAVKLKSLLNSEEYKHAARSAEIPCALGVDAALQTPIVDDVARLDNCLILGAARRSVLKFVEALVTGILLKCSPNDARLVFLGSPDSEALNNHAKIPHLFTRSASDGDRIAAVLSALLTEMRARVKLMGDNNLHSADFKPAIGYPRIFVIFDEIDSVLPLLTPAALTDLCQLAKWGRGVGLQIIASASVMNDSKLPLNLASELQTRVCFKVDAAADSLDCVNTADALKLVEDDLIYIPQHHAKPTRLQPVDCGEDAPQILEHWENAYVPKLPELEVAWQTVAPPNPPANNGIYAETLLARAGADAPRGADADAQTEGAPTKADAAPSFENGADAAEDAEEPKRRGFGGLQQLINSKFRPFKPTPPDENDAEPDEEDAYESLQPAPDDESPREFETPTSPQTVSMSWRLPTDDLFEPAPSDSVDRLSTETVSAKIKQCAEQHGVAIEVDQVFRGPTVTMYGLTPGWRRSQSGREERVKVSQILNLEKDLALALGTPNIRFEPVVDGESLIGLEAPNIQKSKINMRSVLDTDEWREFESSAEIPLALGVGVGGAPAFLDLTKMPHLLVAGATGAGKSVCINALIASVLRYRTPEQVRMIMVDPKRVELKQYEGVPHLYAPIVVEPERAVAALKALVKEMEQRLILMSDSGARDIIAHNQKSAMPLPYLFVIIDELADLMMTSAGEVDRMLARLAQLGRATGIHLLVATQRPSVDVITGTIKSNFASRISFTVTSIADSRTILDRGGGEKLLGRGDMLFLPSDQLKPKRLQGIFVNDFEIERVIENWRGQSSAHLPQLEIEEEPPEADAPASRNGRRAAARAGENDASLLEQAIALAQTRRSLSITALQTRLGIGFPKAARLMDELEECGVVGPQEQGKPRRVTAYQPE